MATDTQQSDQTQVASIPQSTKEKVASGIGGMLSAGSGQAFQGSDLQSAIEKHYQQRLEEARMNAQSAAQAKSVLLHNWDPETGQPLTDEARQRYQSRYDTAYAAYSKAAGVDKNAKGIIARGKAIMDHITGKADAARGQGGQPGAPGAGGGAPGPQGGMPPPPKASMGPGSGMMPGGVPNAEGGGSVLETMPGKGTAAPMPAPPQRNAQADAVINGPGERAALEDKRTQDNYRAKVKIDEEAKIAEAEAAAKAKAANPSGRPVMGPATSVRNARDQAAQGKVFNDVDGNPIDLSQLPDSMGLKFIAWGGKHYYEPFSPNSKVITVGNETYAINPMDVEAITKGAGTDVAPKNAPTTTATFDPTTGQTTTSKHVPTTTGIPGRGSTANPPGAAAPSATPTSKAATPRAAAHQAVASGPGGLPALDADGHISTTGALPATPQVIEGANQLLDGTDKEKIPAKVRELAAGLARKYGWEQGKFTPKEQVMLKEASTFLDQAEADKSLSVLDGDTLSKAPLIAAARNTDKEGYISQVIQSAMAKQMTPDQQQFLRMYNQLVGTISGLSQLVKGGKATEAQISRLRQELPNIITSPSSADAKARIHRLQREIKIAMEKGQFSGSAPTKSLAKNPPPKATNSSIDDEIQAAANAAGAP